MHDKQLLTLNHGFHEWCHLVEGIQHERTVDFEHRYFMMMMMYVLNLKVPNLKCLKSFAQFKTIKFVHSVS